MWELLNDSTFRTVALGTAAIGGLAGFVGTFAVVRRQSLLGDAISHAALPGVGLAFLVGGRSPESLVLGAAVVAWLAMLLVGRLSRDRRIAFDTALGGVLAVFFGIGLSLLTYIKKHVPGSAEHGLDRYLFGQAATMRTSDITVVLVVGLLAVVVVTLFWKQIQLLCFDPNYARVQGWRVRLYEWLLTSLVVLTVVVGLQAVGVVLMSSLLVAPAVAARLWLHRLGSLSILAGMIGAFAGFTGTLLSYLLSTNGRSVPTGPMIVLSVSAIVGLSMFAVGLKSVVRKWASPA